MIFRKKAIEELINRISVLEGLVTKQNIEIEALKNCNKGSLIFGNNSEKNYIAYNDEKCSMITIDSKGIYVKGNFTVEGKIKESRNRRKY